MFQRRRRFVVGSCKFFLGCALNQDTQIKPENGETIDVTKYGVTPTPENVCIENTSNSKYFTDNSKALLALRDRLVKLDRSEKWNLYFPPGCYQYKNNRWTYGFTNLTITAENSKLQCINSSKFSVGDSNWFSLAGAMFNNKGDLPNLGGYSFISGDLIGSCNVGDTEIHFANSANSQNYIRGDRIIIHSFCQQEGGYSPNMRNFEWAEISEVSSGVLKLSRPVEYSHSDEYKDIVYDTTPQFSQNGSVYFGKARVLLLSGRPTFSNVPYYYPVHVSLKGGDYVANPYFPKRNQVLALSAEYVDIDGVSLVGNNTMLVPRESKEYHIKNIRVDGQVEFDKVLDTVILRDSRVLGYDKRMHSLKSATGVRTLKLLNVESAARINVIPSRLVVKGGSANSVLIGGNNKKWKLPNNSEWGPITFYNGTWGGYSAKIDDITLTMDTKQNPVVSGFSSDQGFLYYKTEHVMEGGFVVPYIKGVFPNVIKSLRPDFVLQNVSGSPIAKVIDIFEYNVNDFFVKLSGRSLKIGEIIKWRSMQTVYFDGEKLWGPDT